jgi:ribonuclease HI
MPFYAIARGHNPGIYTSWIEAKKQINNFKNPKFKKFDLKEDAQNFINDHPVMKQTSLLNFIDNIEDPTENDKCLICFTDGACSANGTLNAKASFAVVWPYHQELNYSQMLNNQHTNNRAEYSALIHAIHQTNNIDPNNIKTLIVYTDSMLLIKSLTEWLPGWKKNNWKKSDGEIISNIDLVKELDQLIQIRKISLRHVKAHTGNNDWESLFNDQVDKLAKSALHN